MSTAFSSSTQTNGSANKEVNRAAATSAKLRIDEDVAALRKDIESLRTDVSSLLKHSSKFADAKTRESVEKGVEIGKQAADKATKSFKSATTDVEGRIRQNPLPAVGIALGAGIALSLLLNRK